MSNHRLLRFACCILILGLSSCSGGGDAGGDNPTGPPADPPPSIVTSSLPSGAVGTTYSQALVASGGNGSYQWAVTGGSLPGGLSLASNGTISGTPSAGGSFTFTATVTSSDQSTSRSFSISVSWPTPAITTSTLPGGTVGASYSAQLAATGGDGSYQWSLASGALPSGVSLSAAGVVSGTPQAAGTFSFTATVTSAGLSASRGLAIEVVLGGGGSPPAISSISPAVLLEGQTATITGTNFGASAGLNTVSVGGLPAAVTSASATSLTVTVPNFNCLPPRSETLQVSVGGLSAQATVDVSPYAAGEVDLAPGFYRYTFSGNGCVQLPSSAAGGDFMIGVTSTSETPSSVTPFQLRATPGDAAVSVGIPTSAAPLENSPDHRTVRLAADGFFAAERPSAVGTQRPVEGAALDVMRDQHPEHSAMMESNRALIERLGSSTLRRTGPTRAPAANPTVGETMTLFADSDVSCDSRTQVEATVRYVGANAVWLEDTASPSGTFTEQQFADLDDFYTQRVASVHAAYFGEMSDVDGNSRVLILMTPKVNARPNSLGFVWSGDFFPTSTCATSNQAEIYYGIVPDPAGTFGTPRTTADVLELYPSLLTHEVTHIIQFSLGIFEGAAAKDTWESEGGATLSEQLVAYGLFGHSSGQDLGYTEWSAGSEWYSTWLNDMAFYWGFQGTGQPKVSGAPEVCSWLGTESEGNASPCVNAGRLPYGVASMFLRAVLDRFGPEYPGGEGAMMRRLTRSPVRGWAAISDVTGRRIEQDLAEFYINLWGDGRVGDFAMMSSWNLFDIFSNLAPEARLSTYSETASGFQGAGNVAAGSAFYLRWTPNGSRAPTSLHVTSPGSASTPSTISVWVLRIQ